MVPLCTPKFSSEYSSLLYAFVDHKRRQGYKYNGEIKELQRFDKHLRLNAVNVENISDDCIYEWLIKRPHESDKTFFTRNSVYCQFYNYLVSENIMSFPIPHKVRTKMCKGNFVPYIFTHEEIDRIFAAADNELHGSRSFRKNAPLLFRLLYGTGIRINEALSLTTSDIIYHGEVLLIREGKNDNTRFVTMSDSLSKRVNEFITSNDYKEGVPLFQNGKRNHLDSTTAYDWFRLILYRAGIPHKGKGKGPRLHDLRHTFAVHSMQAAINAGTDQNVFLPLLSTYLGHKTIAATERYLRLTAEAFPMVIKEVDQIMDSVIPEVHYYEG